MTEPVPADRVAVSRHGRVAIVTLDHPPTRNAIDSPTLARLSDILLSLRDDPGVGALVLRAAGPHFSSGADIKERLPTEAELLAGDVADHPTALLHGFPRPTIAAIQGCCIGGGLELVLATDIRIAAADSWFRFTEVTVGLPTGWGGALLLREAVGRSVALDLLLTGRWIDSATALATRLVTKTCPTEELDSSSLDLAGELASRSPVAVSAIKAALSVAGIESALLDEIRNFAAAAASPAAARLIDDFLASREDRPR